MNRPETGLLIDKSDRASIDDAAPGTVFFIKDRLGRPMKIIRGFPRLKWSKWSGEDLREIRSRKGVGRPPWLTQSRDFIKWHNDRNKPV